MNKKTVKRGLLPYLFLIIMIFSVYYFVGVMNQKTNNLTYDKLLNELKNGKVTEMVIVPKSRASVYDISGKIEGYEKNETFFVRAPLSDEIVKQIMNYKMEKNFEITTKADPESSSLLLVLVNVLPILILVAGSFYFLS